MRQKRFSLFHFFTLTALFFATSSAFSASNDNIYTYKVGSYTVSLLSEGQSDGNQSVLLNATPQQLQEYVPNGTYPSAVNTFLVQSANQTVLIDTGFGRELFANLKSLNVSPEQIDSVLLTHMHGDHIGGLLRDGKRSFPKAKLYVSELERAYWGDESTMRQQPEQSQAGFKNAQNVLNSYGTDVKGFKPNQLGQGNDPLLPGITAIAAYGHTPGHTAYMIESNGERLLIWGDLAHAMVIQIPAPDVAVTYDINPEMAVKSRKDVLDYVAKNKIPVAGMHIPYPAIGIITAPTTLTYDYKPVTQ